MKKAFLIILFISACTPAYSPPIPWESNIPEGGKLIYHIDVGFGICGLKGCPTRIIDVTGICITETWRDDHWEFRESKPCYKE